ncbi:hypothetical protein ACLQ2P_41625 [Actinomadura citrea]|uniref:hypothetical protein n=1 Tax=Actinomadura citrea TaxID=46158 RepID=UPI003CE553FC
MLLPVALPRPGARAAPDVGDGLLDQLGGLLLGQLLADGAQLGGGAGRHRRDLGDAAVRSG